MTNYLDHRLIFKNTFEGKKIFFVGWLLSAATEVDLFQINFNLEEENFASMTFRVEEKKS